MKIPWKLLSKKHSTDRHATPHRHIIPDPTPTCLYPRPCANLSLSPTPHQPVFIPNPVPTCLFPWPRANLSLSLIQCQPVFNPGPASTCLYPWPCANLSLSPTQCQPVFIPDPVPTCLYSWPRANLSLFLTPCQPVFVLTPLCFVLSREAANTNIIVFDFTRTRSNSRSIAFQESTKYHTT